MIFILFLERFLLKIEPPQIISDFSMLLSISGVGEVAVLPHPGGYEKDNSKINYLLNVLFR